MVYSSLYRNPRQDLSVVDTVAIDDAQRPSRTPGVAVPDRVTSMVPGSAGVPIEPNQRGRCLNDLTGTPQPDLPELSKSAARQRLSASLATSPFS